MGGSGGSPEAEEEPLAPETSTGEVAPTPGTATSPSLSVDKRTPFRGSLMPGAAGKKARFVIHTAKSAAPVGDGTSFVVAASTGLWQHDTTTLAKRSRLVPLPVLDVASSPDGSRLAYALSGGRVRIVSFPSLASLSSVSVDEPCRMRFSPDGKLLALASQSDTVTLVDVATGKTHVHDTDEDVNDVAPLPGRPNEVAYASDDDEVAISDVPKASKVFGSEPLVAGWRRANRPFFTMRDQLAVAYDSVTNTLLGGGDDNMLWRIDDPRGKPSLRSPIEVGGNVVEIACCAGKSAADRAAFVAVDDLRVRAVALDGRMGPQFGPIMSSVGSFRIRIALLPSGDVLVAPQDALFRWSPRKGDSLRSNDYGKPFAQESALDDDTVFVACDSSGCVVHRVAHGLPAADVETTILGDLPVDYAITVLAFGDGTRAIAGSKGGNLRLVYLPNGGALEAPIDTTAPIDPMSVGRFARKDGATHGFVDTAGNVYEIKATPRGTTKIGTAAGTEPVTDLAWDAGMKRWRVNRGATTSYVP